MRKINYSNLRFISAIILISILNLTAVAYYLKDISFVMFMVIAFISVFGLLRINYIEKNINQKWNQ